MITDERASGMRSKADYSVGQVPYCTAMAAGSSVGGEVGEKRQTETEEGQRGTETDRDM